jgi:shikimate kinase
MVAVFDMDISINASDLTDRGLETARSSNIILLGGMGSGKSTVGWLLARLLGFGFVDLDAMLEARFKKPVSQIFDDEGETSFRKAERETVLALYGVRSHVISVGGGTVMDDDSWRVLERMGVTVWLSPPAEEIARRFVSNEDEIKKRPLLAELVSHNDKETRQKLLTERLSALIGQRSSRYREAKFSISDTFSTPESTSRLIKDILQKSGALAPAHSDRPFDRWSIL